MGLRITKTSHGPSMTSTRVRTKDAKGSCGGIEDLQADHLPDSHINIEQRGCWKGWTQGLVDKAMLEEVESKGKKSSVPSSYHICHGEHEDMENHPEYSRSHDIFPIAPHRPGSNGPAMPAGCPDFWSKCGVCSMSQNSSSHCDTVKKIPSMHRTSHSAAMHGGAMLNTDESKAK